MEMHRRNGSQRWTLAALREHLKEEIRVRTKSDRSFGSSPEAGPSSTGGSKSGKGAKKLPPTSSTLLNQGGKKGKGGQSSKPPPPKSTKPPSCVFCQGEHLNGDCTKYPTVESRLPLIKGKCFNCFSNSHMKNECKSKKNCYHCHKPGHNSSLCYEKYGTPKPADTTAIVSTGGLNPEASEFWPQSTLAAPATPRQQQGRSGTAILESARVEVSGQKGSAKARLVFDNASSLSFIRSDFSNRVGAKTVGRDRTMLGRFGDQDRDEKSFALVQVRLRLRDGSDIQISLRKAPAVSAPLRLVPIPFENLNLMIELNDLAEVITQPAEEEIDILLGLDYYYQIVGPEVSRYNHGIVLKQSAIGKIVTGYLYHFSDSDSVSFGHQMVTTAASPNERDLSSLERFLGIEEVGMVDRTERSDDDIALQLFNDSVQFQNGRYHVRWPFKTDPPDLPINYDVDFRRLVSVCNKLQKTSDLLTTYHDIFMDQLKKGVIEEAPEDHEEPVHYLPHHAVVIPTRETTKVRVVFDASSKPSDRFQSLNESMYRDPVFLNNLCGLLLRFRFPKYTVTKDVEKAFLQIILQRDHRDCTRFIWLRDPLKPPSSRPTSIRNAFYYIKLLHHGQTAAAERLLSHVAIPWNADRVQQYAQNLVKEPNVNFLVKSDKVMRAILLHQLEDPNNPFRQVLEAEIDGVDRADDLQFRVYTGHQEMVFSSGNRHGECRDELPGFDVYASLLKESADVLLNQTPIDSSFLDEMLVNPSLFNPQVSRSILLVSDSQARLMNEIEGCRDVIPVSGGKCGDMINVLEHPKFDLSENKWIVVYCGINCKVKRGYEFGQRDKEWQRLKKIPVDEAARRDRPSVLFCCSFDHPTATRDNPSHSAFIERQLSGTNVLCVNWQRRGDPFLTRRGTLNPKLFDFSECRGKMATAHRFTSTAMGSEFSGKPPATTSKG